MIIGFVSPQIRPLIRFEALGAQGARQEIEAWVDTGFDGELLLTSDVVTQLNLTAPTAITAQLADGSIVEGNSYFATILWDGVERAVQVVETQGYVLAGLALLHGYALHVSFTDGGAVFIEPLA